MSFAHDFRANVIPRMRNEAKLQGLLVALDEIEFGDARHAVSMIAIKGGVGLLAIDQQEEVMDRIPDLIWDAYEEGLRSMANSERGRMKNPVSHYEKLASQSKDPSRLQWVFASICPVYRARLLEQRHHAA